ncbi:uncharacterized protein KY384_004562 [Bacidia gigantensis]|uniref:uncharacterized protein n=1 Tax=Bacidia gigantensis TaxID=2732470 RepID=UPI001D059FB8|nr:uncharacterized protein KY384_004562 [Bacidia gigantensis]KAG8531204.1 hypothetical protein KY384_004562 [Bacidia gigantensis]
MTKGYADGSHHCMTCKQTATLSCFKKEHIGTCSCPKIVDYKQGCIKCGDRRDELSNKPPKPADPYEKRGSNKTKQRNQTNNANQGTQSNNHGNGNGSGNGNSHGNSKGGNRRR